MMTEPIIKKKSKFWYLLPIILGLLGGVIVYFVLRKSDPSKAKICLILGLGITVAYFVYIGSSSTDNTPKLSEKSQESDIQATRAVEEAKYQAELEKQRELETASKFDPIIVSAAKKNLPGMQSLPKVMLEECLKVNSYSDYLTYALAVSIMQDEMAQTVGDIDTALTILEITGYAEHPDVGPLITETRQVYGAVGDCITTLTILYG